MIRFGVGVQVAYFNPRLAEVLEYAGVWALRARVDVDVNSIDDKQHGAGTLHGDSLAIDLDTAGDRMEDLQRLHRFLARYLPIDYDVILERDHVHVEFDMKRRTPPLSPPAAGPAPTPA